MQPKATTSTNIRKRSIFINSSFIAAFIFFANIGKIPDFVNVYEDIEQRNYFSFYNYEYYLDVSRQNKIYPETISLEDGLRDSVKWYLEHSTEVNKNPYFKYINENLVED